MTAFSRRRITRTADGGNAGHQEGVAAVEMALLMPLLVVLVLGVIEFGFLFGQELGIGNGAREGARYAGTTPSADCAAIQARTRDAAAGLDVATNLVRVDAYRGVDLEAEIAGGSPECPGDGVPCDGAAAGDNVYVVTTYDSELAIPFLPNPPFGGVFEIKRTGGFPCEFN